MYSTTLQSSLPRIVLASRSPRRKELLALLGIPFETLVTDADESFDPGASPREISSQLAERKARCAYRILDGAGEALMIIAADTIVVAGDSTLDQHQILNKPANASEAIAMLESLSGRSHQVYTGHSLLIARRGMVTVTTEPICTEVVFRKLSQRVITDCVKSSDPFDKAGGYGIQGGAAPFVTAVHGDFFNIVGLSVRWVGEQFEKEGIWPLNEHKSENI